MKLKFYLYSYITHFFIHPNELSEIQLLAYYPKVRLEV